jgi:hypothetical protein
MLDVTKHSKPRLGLERNIPLPQTHGDYSFEGDRKRNG